MRKLLHWGCLLTLGCTSKVTSTGSYDPLRDGTSGGVTGQSTGVGATGSTTGAPAGVTGASAVTTAGPATGSVTMAPATSSSTGTGGGMTSTSGESDASATTGERFGGFGGASSAGDDNSVTTGMAAGNTTDGGNTNGAGGSMGAGGTSTTGSEPSEECRVMLEGVPVCCTPLGDDRGEVDEVLDLLNAYRNSLGLDALARDPVLEETMQGHCKHMSEADFFSHNSPVPELDTPWDRAEICGTSANAENIARGQNSPASVMDGWQNSSGHDQNMRSTNSSRVGIGHYNRYWGQIFGR